MLKTKTKTKTTTKTNTNTKTKDINVLEVARDWVTKKEEEIDRETSLFRQVTNILKSRVKDISIKPSTLHLVIKYIMELIEETPVHWFEQQWLILNNICLQ